MSSFQLERSPSFHPDVAVILNVTPDHLDRYDSFNDYREAKLNITMNQTPENHLIYNLDDPSLENIDTNARTIGFSIIPGRSDASFHWDGEQLRYGTQAILSYTECALRGRHNLANILAGLNAVDPFISQEAPDQALVHVRKVLRSFPGIPHRLEFVGKFDGIAYYNDSKATNIEAVQYAVESFGAPVILILGGYDKNGEFEKLIPLLQKHTKRCIGIGKARFRIQEALRPDLDVEVHEDLESAMGYARSIAEPGDVILLSPGCASFDQYEDFEERGEHFKRLAEGVP